MPLPEALLTKMEYAVFGGVEGVFDRTAAAMFGIAAADNSRKKGVFGVAGVVKLTVSAAYTVLLATAERGVSLSVPLIEILNDPDPDVAPLVNSSLIQSIENDPDPLRLKA
jgi:hypothetical protein